MHGVHRHGAASNDWAIQDEAGSPPRPGRAGRMTKWHESSTQWILDPSSFTKNSRGVGNETYLDGLPPGTVMTGGDGAKWSGADWHGTQTRRGTAATGMGCTPVPEGPGRKGSGVYPLYGGVQRIGLVARTVLRAWRVAVRAREFCHYALVVILHRSENNRSNAVQECV